MPRWFVACSRTAASKVLKSFGFSLVWVSLTSSTLAQPPSTPEQRRQASAAFTQAVAARAGGDHVSAASLFETADQLAPSEQALGNALQSHRAIHTPNHDARAATLAVRLANRYASNPRMVQFSQRTISELSPTLSRIVVQCNECEIEVDNLLSSDKDFFLIPGEHVFVAHWSQERRDSRTLTTTANHTETLHFTEPELPPTPHVQDAGLSQANLIQSQIPDASVLVVASDASISNDSSQQTIDHHNPPTQPTVEQPWGYIPPAVTGVFFGVDCAIRCVAYLVGR